MKKKLLLLLVFIFIIGCSSQKNSEKKEYGISKLEEKIGLNSQEIQAKISINVPDFKNSADALIKVLNKDTIAIDIFGPFGIKLGYLWSDRDSFVFLNFFQSIVYIGTPSSENFKMSAMIDLSFEDLISILRAEPIAEIDKYVKKESTDNSTIYLRRLPNSIEFIQVDDLSNNIIQYQRQDNNKETTVKVFLENYTQYEDFFLPDIIKTEVPKENGSVTFTINQRLINTLTDKIEKPNYPTSFKLIDLDKLN